jgi:peptide/nickel transport system permease protein
MMIPILLGISFIVLILIDITPGDPAALIAGPNVTEQELEQIREDLGLNKPILVRYVDFITGVFRGDLGRSFINKRPIWDQVAERFPYTLRLSMMCMALAIMVGIPIGIFAATNQYSWKDNFAIASALFCVSMPGFWFALILIQFICVQLRLLPIAGIESWTGWILPTFTHSLGYTAIIARQTRSNLLDVIRQDYITTARAKGQSEGIVLYRHALKNAMIPLVQIIGGLFGGSLGGAMITEVIFSVPGLGSYALAGLTSRDYPVIQANVLILSTMFSFIILFIDIAFAFIDPRIRSQYVKRKKKTAEGEA